MIPPSRQPGRPLWLLAPTTCILTSLDELPPSRERSCTSTTFAPFRAAASAAQTPAGPPPATSTSHREIDQRHPGLALEPPGVERRVERGDRSEAVADLGRRSARGLRLGLAVGEDQERIRREPRRRQEVAPGGAWMARSCVSSSTDGCDSPSEPLRRYHSGPSDRQRANWVFSMTSRSS